MVEFHADYPGTGLRFYCVFTFQVYVEEMMSALNTGDMLESQPEASDVADGLIHPLFASTTAHRFPRASQVPLVPLADNGAGTSVPE